MADEVKRWGHAESKDWLKKMKRHLLNGRHQKVVEAIEELCKGRKAKKISKLLPYFTDHAARMSWSFTCGPSCFLGIGMPSLSKCCNLNNYGRRLVWISRTRRPHENGNAPREARPASGKLDAKNAFQFLNVAVAGLHVLILTVIRYWIACCSSPELSMRSPWLCRGTPRYQIAPAFSSARNTSRDRDFKLLIEFRWRLRVLAGLDLNGFEIHFLDLTGSGPEQVNPIVKCSLEMAFDCSIEASGGFFGGVTVADDVHFETMSDPTLILRTKIRHYLQAQFVASVHTAPLLLSSLYHVPVCRDLARRRQGKSQAVVPDNPARWPSMRESAWTNQSRRTYLADPRRFAYSMSSRAAFSP